MEYQYRELTWEDMRLVDRVLDKMIDDDVAGKLPEEMSDEEYYTEVLNRFNGANHGVVYIPSVWREEDNKKHPSMNSWASLNPETGEYEFGEKYYDEDMNEITKEQYEELTKKPGV